MSKLTLPMLRAAKPGAVLPDPRVAGLRYRYRNNGRTFAELRYKAPDGKWRSEPLGRVDIDQIMFELSPEPDELDRVTSGGPFNADMVLEAVRQRARALQAQLAAGQDPRSDDSGDTLKAVVERFLLHVVKRPRTQVERVRHLGKDWKPLHDRAIASITRRDVAARLLQLREERSPIAANRSRTTLSALYKWAIEQGLLDDNPVTGTGKAPEPNGRDRELSLDELRAVWKATEGEGDHNAIVRLLILTGQRREEVGGMRWEELDLDAALWSLPGERTKNARPHVVPLSTQAVELLRAQERRERAFVFGAGNGGFSGWSRCKARLDAGIADWTLHDLRRSWATRVDELIGAPHVVDAALNHVSTFKTGVMGRYNKATYLPERTRAMQLWADHLLGAGTGEAKVILLHRGV